MWRRQYAGRPALPSATDTNQVATVGDRISEAIADACVRPDDEPIRTRFAAVELGEEMRPRELVDRAGNALTAARTAARD